MEEIKAPIVAAWHGPRDRQQGGGARRCEPAGSGTQPMGDTIPVLAQFSRAVNLSVVRPLALCTSAMRSFTSLLRPTLRSSTSADSDAFRVLYACWKVLVLSLVASPEPSVSVSYTEHTAKGH